MPGFLQTHFFCAATGNHCLGDFFAIVDWPHTIFLPPTFFTWPAFVHVIALAVDETLRSRESESLPLQAMPRVPTTSVRTSPRTVARVAVRLNMTSA